MKIQRLGAMASLALVGSIALAGCGSDNNTGTDSAGAAEGTASSSAPADCFEGTLNVEGSSAQKNAIDEVAAGFKEKCSGATVNYNPSGSGAGIKQFIAGQVDFGGSDSALKTVEKDGKVEATEAATACGSPAWNIPMVTGPVALAYNVKGIDKLTLTPAVAGDIFSGKITTWNDPKIAAVNPGVELPATAIKVFFRSDESGTTENFTKYLKAAAPANWTTEPAKTWDGKGEGKAKSAGVAEGVKSTDGGLTYVEWSYAKDNDLAVAAIDNGAGPVELTSESVGKAIATAEQTGTGNDLALKLDYATKVPGAYPINLVTYEIVCSKGKDPEKQKNIKAFLKYFASEEAQKTIEEIGYAPLPPEVQTKVVAAIDAIS
ncbi:phosphate ABC transporter substrate-binding protein PstS [Knoellia aerolata]|uniref:Phosphate-binding protein n=1 Tax=Knoellia aerolata DSM 18566 TaxID=1385519 RepID=A0A0A0K1E6_9MICO|nr:phosphate ABC transporter substrate-binding protein PstS [Knoellia aerolata]KGN41606.1 phosphate ABC transporter substrate-binding protein [Knoellia aerolata DSM 18566]